MDKSYAIGIDLGGTFIKGGVIDSEGEIALRIKIPTGDLAFDAVCRTIAGFLGQLKSEAGIKDDEITGVGVGSPGGIRNDGATVTQSPNFPEWKDVNLRGELGEQLPYPVYLENDANLAALAENWIGAGKDYDDMALFTLGTGIGGGLILNRKIWRGHWGMAAELGHITVKPDGPLCGCGNRGCLEALINRDAIVKSAIYFLKSGRAKILNKMISEDLTKVTPKAVYQAAEKGDIDCASIFKKCGEYLGIVIAGLLNALNLPIFVIGGGISAAYEFIEPELMTQIRRRAYKEPAEGVVIHKTALGNDAGLLGAAKLVFSSMGI